MGQKAEKKHLFTTKEIIFLARFRLGGGEHKQFSILKLLIMTACASLGIKQVLKLR